MVWRVLAVLGLALGPHVACQQAVCHYPDRRACTCANGAAGQRLCFKTNDGYGPCDCGDAGVPAADAGPTDGALPDGSAAPDGTVPADAEVPTFCVGPDGTRCDGDDLVTCRGGLEVTRQVCARGCDTTLPAGAAACLGPESTFCVGKLNGLWCDGDDLVRCTDDQVTTWETCSAGCQSMPVGQNDQCTPVPFCVAVPSPTEASAPTSACNYMDWDLSEDGNPHRPWCASWRCRTWGGRTRT